MSPELGKMYQLTRKEVADAIESFINGKGGKRSWDDFISISLSDPELEKIRVRCAGLPEEFPPGEAGAYCGERGLGLLRNLVTSLRT